MKGAPASLVVSLHDVSPQTRPACEKILGELAELGVKTCSLLVIPDHHGKGHFLSDREFCEWLRTLSRSGHEIVIHGYFHRRTRRASETVSQKLTTRFYTADEGEFFDLERDSAGALVEKAREEFRSIGLDPAGFIAPAWLLGAPAEEALRTLGIAYTTRLRTVTAYGPEERTFVSQSLVWSVRAGWRRILSRLWNGALFSRLTSRPLMRVSIHPVDLAHPAIWRQIRALIARALATSRIPMTYLAWIAHTQSEPSASSREV